MLLFFMLLSNTTIFAQTSESDATSKIENNEMVNNTVEINAINQDATSNNMNFVIWFMGSKQDPNVKISPASENTRKQFMTSGLAPNRLLIKAFLKKAVNFEIATS